MVNLSGMVKTRVSTQGMDLSMKFHPTSIIFVALLPWQMLVLIPTVANFSSTKIQMTNQVNSHQIIILNRLLMLMLTAVTQA